MSQSNGPPAELIRSWRTSPGILNASGSCTIDLDKFYGAAGNL